MVSVDGVARWGCALFAERALWALLGAARQSLCPPPLGDRSVPSLSIAAMVQPEQTSRFATSTAAMLVCLASSVGGQEPVPLTARAQSLVDEITILETRVMEWEQRATAAENEAARMRKENEALR